MSIYEEAEGVHRIRWREQGHHRSLRVHGPKELAKKILRKKLSARDENRHLDIKKEKNFRMSALIDRYWEQYGSKKQSSDRERSVDDPSKPGSAPRPGEVRAIVADVQEQGPLLLQCSELIRGEVG